MKEEPLVYTIPEAAAMLKISRTTMYRLIKDHHIKTIKVGDVQRITRWELLDYIGMADDS